jgi:hypothetical protein
MGMTTSTKQKKKMTDKELERRIDQKIQAVFERLSTNVSDLSTKVTSLDSRVEATNKSVTRIERVLLGDADYDDDGFVKMIRYSYEHARQNEESKIIPKGWETINHYEQWDKEGKWTSLNEIIQDNFMTKKVKTFFNLGSWAGILALITSLGSVIAFLIYLYNVGLIQ